MPKATLPLAIALIIQASNEHQETKFVRSCIPSHLSLALRCTKQHSSDQ